VATVLSVLATAGPDADPAEAIEVAGFAPLADVPPVAEPASAASVSGEMSASALAEQPRRTRARVLEARNRRLYGIGKKIWNELEERSARPPLFLSGTAI
jgi:hypothetical protein